MIDMEETYIRNTDNIYISSSLSRGTKVERFENDVDKKHFDWSDILW